MAECFSRAIVKGRRNGVLTNHARVGSIPAGGSVMIIRVSGRFTQILRLWMEQYAIDCPSLQARVAAIASRESLPVEQWRALLAEARELTRRSDTGLQIGSQVSLRHLGVLGYLVLNSETLVDALRTYQLGERRFYSVNFCTLGRENAVFTLAWPDRLGESNALFVQTALAALVSFLRQRFPSTFQLHQVALSERPPEDIGAYEQFFGCPVVFGSTAPGISIDYARASRPETGALPRSVLAMQNQQEAAFAQVVAEKTPFLHQLQMVLLRLIPQGTMSLDQVAEALDCSPRTLQRRLGDYHLSYQSLLDGLREQLACRYLLNSSLSFVEIALLLGFSEQSAFNRAFKTWTGSTPGRYQTARE